MKSASDNITYPEFCKLASQNDEVFDTFRQNSVYHEILEHFEYEDGLKYITEIANENPSLLTQIEQFKTNDLYGGPLICDYANIGSISPSTLHYLRQLSYLETYFGDLTGKHIVEIGGGYGGLCKLVIDKYNIASYTIFDLDPVNELVKKYLGKFTTNYLEKVNVKTLENYNETMQFDICISNCAFTECVPSIQEAYINKVIKYCKAGFILYNKRVESHHPVVLLSKLEIVGLKKMGSKQLQPPIPTVFILAWNSLIKLDKLPYKRRFFYKLSPFLYNLLLQLYRKL
jgi:putative sugar O-methyltransferase